MKDYVFNLYKSYETINFKVESSWKTHGKGKYISRNALFQMISCLGINEMFAWTALIRIIQNILKLYSSSLCEMSVGVYAWIGINFVLGRFEHIEDGKYHVSN